MFGTHDLALFAATVLVLNATPGVDLMLTLTRTLQQGVRGGLAAACGICTGCVLHTLAASLGLAALLAASAAAFSVVKWLGAAYLAWLAVGMLRQAATRGDVTPATARAAPEGAPSAADPPAAAGSVAPLPRRDALLRTFRQALLTNALNPKVAIFFLALLPQFVDSSAPHKALAFAVLGAWLIAESLVFLVVFVLLVAPLRRWHPSSRWRRALQGGSGLLFAGLAARLALAEPS